MKSKLLSAEQRCFKLPRYIKAFGIELEGIWKPSLQQYIKDTEWRREYDGTIQSSTPEGRKGWSKELVSPPVNYDKDSEEFKKFRKVVKRCYKDKAEINHSMGLHINVSLVNEGYYPYLTTQRFYSFFKEYLRKRADEFSHRTKSRLFSRFRGNNDYIQEFKNRRDIDKTLNGSKYFDINYRHLRQHNSEDIRRIEFRLLPSCDTAKEVFTAVNMTTSAINKYLHYKRPSKEISEEEIEYKKEKDSMELKTHLLT